MTRTKLLPLFLLLLGGAVVVVILSIVGNPFGNPTLVNFREPVPQPNISLIELQVFVEGDLCGGFAGFPNSLEVIVQFKLVNSGGEDGFAVVEMTARNVVVDSSRYFVRADETQPQILSFENLSCSLTPEQINVRVANVEVSVERP